MSKSNTALAYALHKKYNGVCQSCGDLTSRNKGFRKKATVQHIYPKGDIRRFILKNSQCITLFCHQCNQEDNVLYTKRIKKEYLELGFIEDIDLTQLCQIQNREP